jgi:Cof subfamily protein (haloacid dehalogenase superfamily)
MNIQMIVTDLDGTLLHEDKTVSSRTISTLEMCRKKGIKVVYATARSASADGLVSSQLFDGRIVMNGAMAFSGNEIAYQRLVPYQIARPFLMACDKQGIKITSEVSGMHYSNFNVSEEWSYITYYQITDFSKHDRDAEKLYSCIRDKADLEFIKENIPKELYLTVSRDGLAMIMHKDATKAKAVAALSQKWGIPLSDTVIFGDDLNDIDMLSIAGMSVAMGNAINEVKAVVDDICETNDNDGVAIWLEERILTDEATYS